MQIQDHIYNDYKILSSKEEQAKNRIKKRASKQASQTQQMKQSPKQQNPLADHAQTQYYRTMAAQPQNSYQIDQFLNEMSGDLQKLNKQQVTYDMLHGQTQVLQKQQEILSENQKQVAQILKQTAEQNKQNSVEQNKKQLQELILPLQSQLQQLKEKFNDMQSKEQYYKNQMNHQDPQLIQNNIQDFQKQNKEFNKLAQNASENIQSIMPENSEVVSSMQNANLQAYTKILDNLKKQIQEYQEKAFKAEHELEEKYHELRQISEEEKEQKKYRDAVKQDITKSLANINFDEQQKEFLKKLGGEFDYNQFYDDVEGLASQFDDIYSKYKETMLDYEIAVPNIKIEQKMLQELSQNVPSILDQIKDQLGIKFPQNLPKKQQKVIPSQRQPQLQLQQQQSETIRPQIPQTEYNYQPTSEVHERLYNTMKPARKSPQRKPSQEQVSKKLRNVFDPPKEKAGLSSGKKKKYSPKKQKPLQKSAKKAKIVDDKSNDYSDDFDDEEKEKSLDKSQEIVQVNYQKQKEQPNLVYPNKLSHPKTRPTAKKADEDEIQPQPQPQRITIFPNPRSHIEPQQFLIEQDDPKAEKKIRDFTMTGKSQLPINKFGVTQEDDTNNGKLLNSLFCDFLKDNLQNIIQQSQSNESSIIQLQEEEKKKSEVPIFNFQKQKQPKQEQPNQSIEQKELQPKPQNISNQLSQQQPQQQQQYQPDQQQQPYQQQYQPYQYQQQQQFQSQPFQQVQPQTFQQQQVQQPFYQQQQQQQIQQQFQGVQPSYNLQSYMQNFQKQYPQFQSSNYQFLEPITQLQPIQPSLANNLIQELLQKGRLDDNNSINASDNSSLGESSLLASSINTNNNRFLDESSNQPSQSEGQISFHQNNNNNNNSKQLLTSGLINEISSQQQDSENNSEIIQEESMNSDYSEGQIIHNEEKKIRKIF